MERRRRGEGRTKRQKRAKTFPVPLPDAACLPVPQVKLHQCVEAHNLQEGEGGGEFQKRAKTLQTPRISTPIYSPQLDCFDILESRINWSAGFS